MHLTAGNRRPNRQRITVVERRIALRFGLIDAVDQHQMHLCARHLKSVD